MLRCLGAYHLTFLAHSKGQVQSQFDCKKNGKLGHVAFRLCQRSRCLFYRLQCKWSLRCFCRFASTCMAYTVELLVFCCWHHWRLNSTVRACAANRNYELDRNYELQPTLAVLQGGLLTSMKHYRDRPVTKKVIDHMQQKFSCCGNEKYTDWFQIYWISTDYVDGLLPEVRIVFSVR